METKTIVCDSCGKDRTREDSGAEDYRLHLSAGRLANHSNIRYAMDYPPPLHREHHFCDWKCLKEFVLKKQPG